MKKTILITIVAAILAAPAIAQVDLSNFVALGDSLTAGFVGGGLMDYYQVRSYPALLAQQGGAGGFEMPLISPPGLGPVLVLESLVPLAIGPTDVPIPADPFEYFYNVTLEAPYQNLGVPGSNTYDMLFTTGNIFNLIGGNQDNVMHDLILRTPTVEDPATGDDVDYTALVAAISQSPTFATVWIGSNDFLGAVVAATPIEGVTMTPVAAFEQYYTQIVGAMAQSLPGSQIVVIDLFADARMLPFVSSIPNMVDVPGLGPVQLQGEDGPIEATDRLTLAASALIAQGYGLPVPGSPPLPENLDLATGNPGVVLREAELDLIQQQASAYNQIIAGAAAAFPNVHVLNMNPTLEALASGTYRSFGGIELTTQLLVGGIFSYDGIHPQNVGYAVVAYELIDFLNSTLGAGLPQINMYDVLTEGDWQSPAPLAVCGECDPKDAILTRDAFLQLYEIFLPDMARRMRQQTPTLAHVSSVD
jgi:lysophospholipase L1-like esterase